MGEGHPAICEKGGGGLIFPLTQAEHAWPNVLCALLYGAGLVYFFLGVSIVSDVFMGSIEKITGTRVQKRDPVSGRVRTGMLWNETVATLTLMALGSSAPEIFLSIIDMIKRKFHFGALGPATIVGSASFNLLVIVAVCVIAIPSGEVRRIINRPAFYITAAFSLFAYVWLAGIVTQSTPGIVDLWEAIGTLVLLPTLIYVSYKFDRGDAERIVQLFSRFGHEDNPVSEEEPPTSVIRFECDRVMLRGSEEKTMITLLVRRSADVPDGIATVQCRTEALSAVPGRDYEEIEEACVEFEPGQLVAEVLVTILPKPVWRSTCSFLVILEDPDGGMGFDGDDDGGEDAAFLTVTVDRVVASASELSTTTRLDSWLNFYNWSKGLEDWKDQFTGVIFVNGSMDEQAEASKTDWVMHFITMPWRLAFMFFPPVAFCGGWFAFVVSLLGIAGVTACISDLAELFGCVMHIPDIVTAFTFVALGTSMPDMFASLTAAKEDPSADASIVNVTGSNSVNVYLGLGLPWTMAALYWKFTGRTKEWEEMYPEEAARIPTGAAFVVEHMNMGFVVLTFCVICCVALLLLHYRRKWLGGELGGSLASKLNTFFCFMLMWIGWVALCSWRILRYRDDWFLEPILVQGGACSLLVVGLFVSFAHMKTVSVRFRRLRDIALAEAAAARRTCRNSLNGHSRTSSRSPDMSLDRSTDKRTSERSFAPHDRQSERQEAGRERAERVEDVSTTSDQCVVFV